MYNLVVLGSTGSIGKNTLDVIRRSGGFNIVGLSCFSNIQQLGVQIDEFKPKYVCVVDKKKAELLKGRYKDIEILTGSDGLVELVMKTDVDFVVNALVGTAGLLPTYYAIFFSKRLALANKESLVVAGSILRRLADKKGVEIVPIDSEHSAIYQCLNGEDKGSVEKIILTASGGPFLNRESFDGVTKEDALSHPNWRMGKKITIDSATMMNKGFEIIEARWLFDISYEKIDVVIHPESIVHSAVQFVDGSIIAQIADHDMRIPIAYALYKPRRVSLPFKINIANLEKLTFSKPDFERFPTLKLAYDVLKKEDKNLGIVLSVADEIAIERFLNGNIEFKDIFDILIKSVEMFEGDMPEDIDSITKEIDYIKRNVEEFVGKEFGGLA